MRNIAAVRKEGAMIVVHILMSELVLGQDYGCRRYVLHHERIPVGRAHMAPVSSSPANKLSDTAQNERREHKPGSQEDSFD